MLQYLVPLLFTLSTVTSYQSIQPYSRDTTPSAASPAQIRFAEENKYDDTGPGAKKPDYAYSTYKTLEEALVAYLDDPDTKLPEFERSKAVQKLLQTHAYQNSGYYTRNYSPRPYHQPQQVINRNPYPSIISKTYFPADSQIGFISRDEPFGDKFEKKPEPFKFHKLHTVKGNPISLAHYTRDPELSASPFKEFNPFPKYSYSYGAHDKKSAGELKQASERQDAGNVRGFYSFTDANGKQHTVHYTSDDSKGFRAAGNYPGTT